MSYGKIIKKAVKAWTGIESANAAKKLSKGIKNGRRPTRKLPKGTLDGRRPTRKVDNPITRMDDSARREFARRNLK